MKDKNSTFYTYQKLIQLRKDNEWIVYGGFELLDTSDDIFAYLRKYEGKKYLVVVNMSDDSNHFTSDFKRKAEIISNDNAPTQLKNINLAAWDAFACEVNN